MHNILITGGCGYLGSHMCLHLIEKKLIPIVIDNLSNSTEDSLKAIEKQFGNSIPFYEGDIRDKQILDEIFAKHKIVAVIHFAGLKSVRESVEKPLDYYNNNLVGTLQLIETMKKHECFNLIFSSSATVYGVPKTCPIKEDAPTHASCPYGHSKLMIEEMLQEIAKSDPRWKIIALRYFNPIGSDKSYILSDNPRGTPENLIPFIIKVLGKELPELIIYGNDYHTNDGTAIRDYIHVTDLIHGHEKALEYMLDRMPSGFDIFNLGSGRGFSVLDVVKCFHSLGLKFPYKYGPRRTGDVPSIYASVKKAKNVINWDARYSLSDMCKSAWLSYMKRNQES